jgi:hypothetical protein
MKKFQLLFLGAFVIPLLFSSFEAPLGGEIPEGIVLAFKAGNSKELSKYFNSNLELVIVDNENVYSKPQAEQIIKDFFMKHIPKNFTILHEGGKEESRYAIGNLVTNNGIFRVYFLLKHKDNMQLIHQLRIETEAND